MPSHEENKLLKRTKILEAAYELFSKNGINMTPIDDVVKKAGVAKGTFYLYFKDKFDLTDQIVLHKSTVLVKNILEEVAQQAEKKKLRPIDQILLFTDKIIDRMIENREILVLINSKMSGLFHLLVSDNSPEIQQNIENIVNMFKRMGYSEEVSKKFFYIISNMLLTVCCESILTSSPYSIEEIRPEIHTVLSKLLTKSKLDKERMKLHD